MDNKDYLLTNPQKSIYLSEEYYKGTNINNIAGIMKINDIVDFDKFILAIKELVKQNDSYRIILNNKNGKIVQNVHCYEDFEIPIINVSSNEELFSIANEIAQMPFSLYNSYLFKFVVFRFPNNHGGFIINTHHLISDSWSLGITVNEINEIYSSLLKNKKYEPKDVSLYSYTNYIASELEYKNSSKYEKDKEYWKEIFSTIPDNATIPSLNNNDKQVSSIAATRKQFAIPTDLLKEINKYCVKEKASLFNFLIAIFSLYISRVSNTEDFCIGTPILNRTNFKEKKTTGMFINTLPLRISIDNTLSFKGFLSLVASNSRSLLKHQRYSYQNIIEDLRKKQHDLPNLYNIMISYQITKMDEDQKIIPHVCTWLFNNAIADDIDIHIFDLNSSRGLNIAYDYNLQKYTSKEIEQFHERILNIIAQVLNAKDLKLSDIEIVTSKEKEILLNKFNQTKINYPRNKTIVELFEEQVSKHSNEIAITFEGNSLTYEQLNEKANQLAHFLKNNYKITSGDIVGLFIDKSLEMIIAMFAILKAGGAFLPLDIELPAKRLQYILENSKPKLILTSKIYTTSISKLGVSYLAIDLDSASIYGNPAKENLPIFTTPDDLIYIIYTSGSTGTPKGVMVKQRNIVRLVKNPNFLSFEEHEIMVQTGTIVFDACIFEIFGSLLNGFKLYILKKDELLDFSYMKDFIKNKNVTILFLTTGLLNQLTNEDPSIFTSIRYLLTGGDIISPTHIKKIYEQCPNIKIINCYGPTENGSYSTCYNINKDNIKSNIPIGKPISNSTCYIVSKSGSLQPIGVPGELWVGGDGVARGYINREDLTKEKFQKNPFGEGYIYKTGDFVKYLPDGNILFLSRIDKQIKLRGFRIELEEIDNNILDFSNIKESISILVDVNNKKTICSYITSNEEIEIQQLKAFLTDKLPDYMIPKYIVQLEKFPLTISGKIDRKALPIPENNLKREIISARNEIDNTLMQKISSLLSIENLSIEDSFFEIGGDSLAAISLASAINSVYSIPLTVKDIFTHPTIRELSDYVENNIKNVSSNHTIPKAEEKPYYPISAAQRRIYYNSSMDKDSLLYNIAGGLEFGCVPDISKLEDCFRQLIKRHESLRTSFTIFENDVYQVIKEDVDFSLKVEKQNGVSLQKLFKEFVKPFSLDNAPLLDAHLIIKDDNKATLFLNMHHIISDGASLSIFLNELSCLYNGEKLPENNIDYKDFAVWENDFIESTEYEENKKYWLDQFAQDIPLLNMPCTLPRPAKQSFEGDSYYFTLDNSLSKKILEIAKEEKLTPNMLLLAAYYILLYKYTDEKDIVIGMPIMNRENYHLENVIGMFVNNLPLRIKIDSNDDLKTFLQKIKDICLNGFVHQNYPFNNLVKDLNLKRDISRNPIFDTMFIYQNNGYETINFGNISAKYYVPNLKVSKFDFSLEVVPNSNNFEMRFEYCTKLFTKDYIEKLAKHYKNILAFLADNLNTTISQINILSQEEENKILHEFNNTYMPYSKDTPLLSLFEEYVKQAPSKTAIIFEDSSISYSDLNKKANKLAHCLVEKYHIHKNDVVGILLKRSMETIISMLAVLKAGATYLLIDEALPFDRILYMLENSNSTLLITDNKAKNIDFSNKLILDELDYDKYSQNTPEIYSSNDEGFCVIYTSGSTGTPKGILLKRLGISNLILNYQKVLGTNQCENFLSISTVSFDMFIVETFVSLFSGKTLILSNEEEQKIPVFTCDLITKYNIDFILTTPSRMNLLIDNSKNPNTLKNLKVIQLGGEVFTPELYEKLKNITNANIYNGYGPSESTACCSSKKVSSNDITIGTPFYNTKIYICNEDLNLVPIGFKGEICISGDGIACGYINNEELTKKSFVKDPFSDGILYKTGDLGYYTEDGEIEYIGRKDFQIKIRGLRVELSEIEKQMLKLPNITGTAVIYNSENQYIAGFFTSTCKQDITFIRNELTKSLPLYMVPKYFKELKELPITPNGKVNKKQLQNYDFSVQESSTNYVAPQTEKQKLFCKIWSNLLNHEIGIEDNVFECGADSLIAIKFKIELLSYDINIPYSNIFDYPTVKELAENCSQTIKQEKVFDYSIINKVLEKNSVQNVHKSDIIKCTNNNILLLGSNGFVGAHILYSFIKNDKGTAYCIVRNKKGENGYERLINVLHFYFGTELDKYINNRIIILTGDILNENLGLATDKFNTIINNISTIINAAAIVKHYGNKKAFEKINVGLSKNLTSICSKYKKRLLHLSSTSVSGNSNLDTDFTEKNLYIGQSLDNIYVKSKFDAEKLILEEIAEGLDAIILRLGNMTNRFSDGVFQINADSNAFISRLKTFINMKVFPESFMKIPLEFTPVDLCANAIIAILQNNIPEISVLHLYNDCFIHMDQLINVLSKNGFDLKPVSDEQFEIAIKKILKSGNKDIISGITVDMNENNILDYKDYVSLNSEFSKFCLNLIGFKWNIIDNTYLEKYITYLKKIKFI